MNRMIHHAVYKPKTLVFENTDLFVVHMLQTLIYQKGFKIEVEITPLEKFHLLFVDPKEADYDPYRVVSKLLQLLQVHGWNSTMGFNRLCTELHVQHAEGSVVNIASVSSEHRPVWIDPDDMICRDLLILSTQDGNYIAQLDIKTIPVFEEPTPVSENYRFFEMLCEKADIGDQRTARTLAAFFWLAHQLHNDPLIAKEDYRTLFESNTSFRIRYDCILLSERIAEVRMESFDAHRFNMYLSTGSGHEYQFTVPYKEFFLGIAEAFLAYVIGTESTECAAPSKCLMLEYTSCDRCKTPSVMIQSEMSVDLYKRLCRIPPYNAHPYNPLVKEFIITFSNRNLRVRVVRDGANGNWVAVLRSDLVPDLTLSWRTGSSVNKKADVK